MASSSPSIPPRSALQAKQTPYDILVNQHKKEAHELHLRLEQKRKSATKKTRRGIYAECDFLERELKDRHERELDALDDLEPATGGQPDGAEKQVNGEERRTEPNESEDILSKVSSLSIDSTATTKQQTSSAAADPTPPRPRKPNRAKARLARRAAEITALSESAALEAASQPDARATELATLRARFEKLGLVEQDIPPDGHCLYSAFADQLEHIGAPLSPLAAKDKYKLTRKACAEYISSHRDYFAPFIEEDIDIHIAKVANTAEWGGHTEVLALAKAYNVAVNIVQAQGREVEKIHEEEAADRRKNVWLAYYRHSFGLGEHYNSLRRKD